ncbi:hypothetical protein [Bacillus weihaiensis]|uniref:hypothetical protein n=1 Tax=Bacillus weihaiensis TaxID=1547283 RepID=UPI00235446AD|nr:hypothetical protein [Bacillus weihaiensis]
MDSQLISSLIGGIVGALVGGAFPFYIYKRTESKKMKEKRLENLLLLRTEIEYIMYRADDLNFEIKESNFKKDRELIQSTLADIRSFILTDIFETQRKIPHLSIFIDTEFYNKSVSFIEATTLHLGKKENEMKDFLNYSHPEESEKRIEKYVESRIHMLETISDESRKVHKLIMSKINLYYNDYQKKYI